MRQILFTGDTIMMSYNDIFFSFYLLQTLFEILRQIDSWAKLCAFMDDNANWRSIIESFDVYI